MHIQPHEGHQISYDPQDGTWTLYWTEGLNTGKIRGFHHSSACADRKYCDIHDRRDPVTRDCPLIWAPYGENAMYYACEDGFLHPTPQQVAWWEIIGYQNFAHPDCDGCCAAAW